MNQNSLYTKIKTDENLMETFDRGDLDYTFYYYYECMNQFEFNTADWHWHDELEVVYIEKGSVTFSVAESQIVLQEGEAIIINSKILHRLYSNDNAIIPNFLFAPDFISPSDSRIYLKYVLPYLSSSITYQIFLPDNLWQSEILDIIKEIISVQKNTISKELDSYSLLLKFWSILYQHTSLNSETRAKDHSTTSQARLQIMMQYIQTYYSRPMTLFEISKSAQLSKSSALNLFQKILHTSPVNYLIDYRLKIAARLLLTTDSNISVIAESSGFDSTGYFCRKFKDKYHLTPTQYRNQKKHVH